MTTDQDDDGLAEFTAYFVRNYPGPHTIIGRPAWHAPKIFRAAQYAIADAAKKAAPAAANKQAPVAEPVAPTFEVRVAGPDDVHLVVGELAALRAANSINLAHVADCLANPNDHVMCVATVHALATAGTTGARA